MENASKALIIAGSVLIGMVVLSILVLGWNRVSSYYKGKEESETTRQIAQKNKELESYNKELIRGYELRSLYNLIEDMNERYPKADGFEPITAKLILVKRYDGDGIDISKNPVIELPQNNKHKDEDGTIVRDTSFYSTNKDKDTLCRFMRVIYNGIYEGNNYSQQKKIFNESYFKCTEMKYNGEDEQHEKGIVRVQSFKFEQILRNN